MAQHECVESIPDAAPANLRRLAQIAADHGWNVRHFYGVESGLESWNLAITGMVRTGEAVHRMKMTAVWSAWSGRFDAGRSSSQQDSDPTQSGIGYRSLLTTLSTGRVIDPDSEESGTHIQDRDIYGWKYVATEHVRRAETAAVMANYVANHAATPVPSPEADSGSAASPREEAQTAARLTSRALAAAAMVRREVEEQQGEPVPQARRVFELAGRIRVLADQAEIAAARGEARAQGRSLPTAVSDLFRQAGDLIQANGLHKGDFYDEERADRCDLPVRACALCAAGAVRFAAPGDLLPGDESPLSNYALSFLARHVNGPGPLDENPIECVAGWNDRNERTAPEVIAALREMAALHRPESSRATPSP